MQIAADAGGPDKILTRCLQEHDKGQGAEDGRSHPTRKTVPVFD